MSYAARVLRATLRRLLVVQLLLVLPVVLAYAVIKGGDSALAAGYGGGIALINTAVMAWRVGRANSKRALAEFYIGASIRFGGTLLLMAIGMGVLKLDPLALLLGFAAAQLGYLFNRVPMNTPD
ncbi:ATP synthase subunit I [Nitrosococcus wardiae]|uniref:ATP synthase subunit I n=1 Tax=Nitrosococcus wardiae TaxID=1814290 RepID=A0A4P7BV85_9GAMM|nr:ATP synthase subunit I [Nitrosococcus wardiae]QBQ53791.1 ATP synthase subunit I [Nitrosococcus wardiae]